MCQLNKKELRQMFLKKRDAIPQTVQREWSANIEETVLRYICEHDFDTVMLYASFRSEPETTNLLKTLLEQNVCVALPKCRKDGVMEAFIVKDACSLQSGTYGILEPQEDFPVAPEKISLVLVPGCAFGKDGSRIGYGGGYYDRFLPRCKQAVKIGLCYSPCLADILPRENFDVTVDVVITEQGVVNKL